MRIKYKLGLSTLLQLLVLLFLLYFYYSTNSSLSEMISKGNESNSVLKKMNEFSLQIKDYFNGTITYERLSGDYNNLTDIIGNNPEYSDMSSSYDSIMKKVEETVALNDQNNTNINSIMQLTSLSIERSNSYIEGTIANLADETKRNVVTTLEINVIGGASSNTNINYQIQVLTNQMIEDISEKDQLLKLLDVSIENSKKDEIALADTAFVELPKANIETNNEIKALVTNFTDNISLINSIESNTFRQISDNNEIINAKTDEYTNNVYSSFKAKINLLLILLMTIFLIIIVLNFVITRSVNNIIKESLNLAKAYAEGDFAARPKDKYLKRNDDLGIMSQAFSRIQLGVSTMLKSIDEVSNILNQIADGNLLYELNDDYIGEFVKIKDSLGNIKSTLTETIIKITVAADEVSSGSSQMSNNAQALAQGATEQTSTIDEISVAFESISDKIIRNANGAETASKIASKSGEQIIQSNNQMHKMTEAMYEIRNTSDQIKNIIKTIEDIAFQTNILALNASVEAARAGVSGKGFAVVAEEVKNLANKSSKAAKNTADLIESSIKAIETGTSIAFETAKSLMDAVESSNQAVTLIDEISQASKEQAAGISQVSSAVKQISTVVQINSATAEESAASSQELNSQAELLMGLVSKFTVRKNSKYT